ncbi:MAG TPA: response regulator [Herpetosiphon sp.]|uniref:Response regulator receiver protein n=1 Tax=Herpetosiphon aurantiacus (strain ATCC 23779 / DSM 785 / 114-95) TaxID=316274 RepID=A9B0T8_HERA2|nr:response regulator [Herpetosiphon sp.]ABX03808.1 response regulator receiver protein [Herpetosiphon aurantiacus DSM 785]HBW49012.1 response regulator [Herpetosiphon sp.]
MNYCIIVDDLAVDRQLAARYLQAAGYQTSMARSSKQAIEQLQQALAIYQPSQILLLVDLNMPNDPALQQVVASSLAGANLALQLQIQIANGSLPPLAIVALTALSASEVHQTAIAFGCDAVLEKPATPDLAQRIEQALATSAQQSPIGSQALLNILRLRLLAPTPSPPLNEEDLTKALLQLHRQGLVGLGTSHLAKYLFPQIANDYQRGLQTQAKIANVIREAMQLNVLETLAILEGEFVQLHAPQTQAQQLHLSKSEYYRRRKEAIAQLYHILAEARAESKEHRT